VIGNVEAINIASRDAINLRNLCVPMLASVVGHSSINRANPLNNRQSRSLHDHDDTRITTYA